MFENFRFETFVDVHSNIFEEYLSSVIAKLPKENPEYRAVSDKIESLYEQYPKVMFRIQKVQAIYLSRLHDMQQEAIYFRGCYDSVGYLKKAGIL